MDRQSSLFNTLPGAWRVLLSDQEQLLDEIESKIFPGEINPEREIIFKAFRIDPSDIKLVILGQDPYPMALPSRYLQAMQTFQLRCEISCGSIQKIWESAPALMEIYRPGRTKASSF